MNTPENDKETKISKIIDYVMYLLNNIEKYSNSLYNIQKYSREVINKNETKNKIRIREIKFIKAILNTTNSFNLFEIEDLRRMLNEKDIETINIILIRIKDKVEHYATVIRDETMLNLGGGKKPLTKKSASKKPVVKKPASKKPVVKKPASKKPSSKKSVSKK
jgi:hypothetical protein